MIKCFIITVNSFRQLFHKPFSKKFFPFHAAVQWKYQWTNATWAENFKRLQNRFQKHFSFWHIFRSLFYHPSGFPSLVWFAYYNKGRFKHNNNGKLNFHVAYVKISDAMLAQRIKLKDDLLLWKLLALFMTRFNWRLATLFEFIYTLNSRA